MKPYIYCLIASLSLISASKLHAESDYQLLSRMQPQLDDELEPSQSPAMDPKTQRLEIEGKIQKTLNLFSNRIDSNLRAEIEKALKDSIIENREIREAAKADVGEKKSETKKELKTEKTDSSKAAVGTANIPVSKQISKSNESQVNQVANQKSTQDRIAEINKALSNPKLGWSEFEKLLDERKSLERQIKAAAQPTSVGVASRDTQNRN